MGAGGFDKYPRQPQEAALSLIQLGITGERPNAIYESLKYTLLTPLLRMYYAETLVHTLRDKHTRMGNYSTL